MFLFLIGAVYACSSAGCALGGAIATVTGIAAAETAAAVGTLVGAGVGAAAGIVESEDD
jgi:hypothetical protein